MPTISDVFTAVGAFVVGGGFIGAVGAGAVWLSRTFSEKWLNAKFEERLAAYKHAQQKELEHLKGEINAQFDRTTKLNQREFEALPEAWRRLSGAYAVVVTLVSRFQSIPDVSRMYPDQLEDFLADSELSEWERQAIRDATDKTEAYRRQFEPYKIAKAKKASHKFYVFFRSNGIFIREPIRKLFEMVDDLVIAALTEHEMNFQHSTRSFVAIDKLGSEGELAFKKLEREVQDYLWGGSNTDPPSIESN
jgi:hypothetical protein